LFLTTFSYLGAFQAPKSEFAGAVVFEVIFVALVMGSITTIATFWIITIRYDPISTVFRGTLSSLIASLVVIVLGGLTFGRLQNGFLWTIGVSYLVLAIGIVLSIAADRY